MKLEFFGAPFILQAIVKILTTLLHFFPFVLKFCPKKWESIIGFFFQNIFHKINHFQGGFYLENFHHLAIKEIGKNWIFLSFQCKFKQNCPKNENNCQNFKTTIFQFLFWEKSPNCEMFFLKIQYGKICVSSKCFSHQISKKQKF